MEFRIDIGYVYIYIYRERERERKNETRLRAGRPEFGDVYYLRRRVRDCSGVQLSKSSCPAVGVAGCGAGCPPPSGAGTGSAWGCASSPRFFMVCCLINIILYVALLA
jgi:hypothetical protein